MNVGWYIVYLLMIAINTVMTTHHGFGLNTWQYWVWSGMLILTFVAGASYKKEDT